MKPGHHMNIFKKSLVFSLALLLTYCAPKTIPYSYHATDESQQETEEILIEPEETAEDIFANFSVDSITIHLKVLLDSIERNDLFQINGEYIFSKNVLPEMYQKSGFFLNWHNDKNRLDALECLKKSWTDGLIPNDYHLEKILLLREDILNNMVLDYNEIAQFDILLTDGLLLYSYHLIKGKINPNTLNVNWNFSSRDIPQTPTKLFQNAIEKNIVMETVYDFRPAYAPYLQFVNQMIRYQMIEDNGGWDKVNVNKVIKPQEFNSEISSIRKRLFVTGDIEFEEGFMDSLYDEDMVNAIKKFQSRHGLNPDGVIGKNTLEALNKPIGHKIDQIKINMERARWILGEIDDDMILVNIANFKLFYLLDSVREHETKVMVGTYYNQTPIFKSKLKYLVFNPTWTVPYSIASKEILPKLKKDPNYLADRNISLLTRAGKAIPQSSVDWSQVSQSNFSYTLRQEPGPGNALGQVKFIFPNKYAVYLHDTPSKYLFVKEERAFSHGCIRVQNPLEFAEVLLKDQNWDKQKIQEVLSQKKEKIVKLKKPLDVLLLYWTCGFMENKDIFFVNDVYNRDPKILKGLQNTNWEKLMKEYQQEIQKNTVLK